MHTEVMKLLELGIVEECQYTKWLAHIVLVKESKWNMVDEC